MDNSFYSKLYVVIFVKINIVIYTYYLVLSTNYKINAKFRHEYYEFGLRKKEEDSATKRE